MIAAKEAKIINSRRRARPPNPHAAGGVGR